MSDVRVVPFEPEHLDTVVELSLRAWTPVFDSLEGAMDAPVFEALYPDWRAAQRDAVKAACESSEHETHVALLDGEVVGFVDTTMHAHAGLGEIHMIAVDPERQCQGIAAQLTEFAVVRLREAGASVAMVETGGDPGHAPARATYESAGFRLLPIARYFRKL